MATNRPLLSVVVPLFNESAGLAAFHESLMAVLKDLRGGDYETTNEPLVY